jgi:hypothetical protein
LVGSVTVAVKVTVWPDTKEEGLIFTVVEVVGTSAVPVRGIVWVALGEALRLLSVRTIEPFIVPLADEVGVKLIARVQVAFSASVAADELPAVS